MIRLIRENSSFFIGFGIYLLGGLGLLIVLDKGDLLLWLNAYHTPIGDYFFRYYTFVGDGIFNLLIAALLFFFHWRKALATVLSFAAVGLLVQLLKRLVFYATPRPKTFFGDRESLHFVEGVSIHAYQSFPSGHSATAFSVFCLLTFFVKDKRWGAFFFIAALLAALSRMYLLQHFLIDVYFGALLGVLISSLIYYYLGKEPTSAIPPLPPQSKISC
ncbi:MAG: phosphatase PAP2 family protein [Bacteroidia bacterium]|nr:phosphatase PAP2 family protein [Bacteroidia bacterium]